MQLVRWIAKLVFRFDRVPAVSATRLTGLGLTLVLAASVGCGSGATEVAATGGGNGTETHGGIGTASNGGGGGADDTSSAAGGTPGGTPTPSTATASGSGQTGKSIGASVIDANPSNYLALLRNLKAGDTLRLALGDYDDPNDVPGLPLFNMNGTASQPITITGPESGPLPRLLGRSTHNTVRLSNASYVIVRNLEIDGRDLGGSAVAAQGATHHITIENLYIHGVGTDQQLVAISTVGSPTWNWTLRGNTIIGAGTGMYLGNSDGTSPFIAGLIENNLIRDTIGYNLQIKHQVVRTLVAGMPTGTNKTIIRHNVFSKSSNGSTGINARPNLLVGHFPPSGPGSDDSYEIYGNFFWQNPTEALFQGEGNVSFYSNVLMNENGPGINIAPHNDVPKTIHVFGNTVLAATNGIVVRGGASGYVQRVQLNAVFAATPITAPDQISNITGPLSSSSNYLNQPQSPLGQFDAYPKIGTMRGTDAPPSSLPALTDADRDFNGSSRDWTVRGAYAGEGANPGWKPAMTRKP